MLPYELGNRWNETCYSFNLSNNVFSLILLCYSLIHYSQPKSSLNLLSLSVNGFTKSFSIQQNILCRTLIPNKNKICRESIILQVQKPVRFKVNKPHFYIFKTRLRKNLFYALFIHIFVFGRLQKTIRKQKYEFSIELLIID